MPQIDTPRVEPLDCVGGYSVATVLSTFYGYFQIQASYNTVWILLKEQSASHVQDFLCHLLFLRTLFLVSFAEKNDFLSKPAEDLVRLVIFECLLATSSLCLFSRLCLPSLNICLRCPMKTPSPRSTQFGIVRVRD